MFGPSFHYIASDDESDRTSLPFTTTEPDWRHRFGASTSHLQPVHAASDTLPSYVLRNDILPSNNFTPGTPTQTSIITGYFDSFPSFPSSTLPGVPIMSDASDSHSSHLGHPESLGIDSSISQRDLHAVTIPNLIGHLQYDGELMSAHEASYGFSDNHVAAHSGEIPSSSIAMPMATGLTFGAGMSNYTDPVFRPGAPPPLSSGRSTSTFQNLLPFNPAHGITPCEDFGTESYVSLSHPSILVSPRLETSLNQVFPQPNVTASSDRQLYTITVPSEAVKFPPPPLTEKNPFFRCQCKNDCGTWITSEDRAIKDHMTRVHKVLKEEDGSFHCAWAHCSTSGEWSGMVRHVQTHLLLKWQCTVCERQYARRDSVRGHANRVSGCESARPISYPSELAYTAWNNGDGTVTLTKMLQPKN